MGLLFVGKALKSKEQICNSSVGKIVKVFRYISGVHMEGEILHVTVVIEGIYLAICANHIGK